MYVTMGLFFLLPQVVPPASVCTGNGCAIDTQLSGSALPLEGVCGSATLLFCAVLWGADADRRQMTSRRPELVGSLDRFFHGLKH